MCEAAGIEDYQLMDMVDQGVSGLDESRPYAIVLNGNYASLAPYYGPVFEKAVKEAALRAEARQSGRRRGLAGPLSMADAAAETIARKLVDEEEKRREASGYFECSA
ncbi:hypothetical protein JL720_11858 [Aureococcus anophagefferens]|nr:hypothetical protein JL720_11858 [Aureococcus anophagefferens]